MKHDRTIRESVAGNHEGHPYDEATYLDRLSPRNARIAARLGPVIFPNFDAMQARIRAERTRP